MGGASVIWSEYPQCSRAAFGKSPVGLCPVGLYIVEPRGAPTLASASLRSPGRLALGAFSTGGCAYQLDTEFPKGRRRRGADRLDRPAGSASRRSERGPAIRNRSRLCARGRRRCRWHGAQGHQRPLGDPNTGAGGNITPLAAAYNDGSLTCRDFLASYVHGPAQGWLQGEACHTAHGQWEVRSLRPFKQGWRACILRTAADPLDRRAVAKVPH